MPTCDHIIGIYYDYEDTDVITYDELKKEVRISTLAWPNVIKPLRDYLDGRVSTNFRRFNFCPMCGEKIDYKALREKAREDGGDDDAAN